MTSLCIFLLIGLQTAAIIILICRPVFAGRAAPELPERRIKILGIGETAFVGDFCVWLVRGQQQILRIADELADVVRNYLA